MGWLPQTCRSRLRSSILVCGAAVFWVLFTCLVSLPADAQQWLPPQPLSQQPLPQQALLQQPATQYPLAQQQPQQPPLHPALVNIPQFTVTTRGLPGDPVNVAFVGSEEELHIMLIDAGWYPADPVTLKTSLKIVTDTLIHRQYADAPVSPLFLWGRKQDLAFEQPVGDSPKQRHHVRFWRSSQVDQNGKPLWIGAATYDTRVEISRTTLGITHRIAPDVDTERDKLVTDAQRVGELMGIFWVDGFHTTHEGRNGGGDPYYTDGRLAVGVLTIRR